MRIFKYWQLHTKEVPNNKDIQAISTYGGSNVSIEDTIKDAERKFKVIHDRISGNKERYEDYEVDIMEEIILKIDDNNIVTRNRYGALVLNSKSLIFIDVDEYKKSFWELIFKKNSSIKELMLQKITTTIKKNKYSKFGFRVYETFKGYRIMVINGAFQPKSKESQLIMKDFRADYLYRYLCVKQNCYRARLTPKPFRIKKSKLKIKFPYKNDIEKEELDNWVKEYNALSEKYATCKLVLTYGYDVTTSLIDYHDKVCKVKTNDRLA